METTQQLHISTLKPFGVSIRNLDVNSDAHLLQIRKTLPQNGVIVLPAHSEAPGSPLLHHHESLTKLAMLFGKLETTHPINKNVEDSHVQILETMGQTGNIPDSWQFHADMTWRVSPTFASVLCGKLIPPEGGDTCFVETEKMYRRLSPYLQEQLSQLTFVNLLSKSYAISTLKQKAEMVGIHPGVIAHPVSGRPCLFVNENTTAGSLEMEDEKTEKLLKQIFSEVYSNEHVLCHTWKENDVVIWDNFATQHLARKDYVDLRRMYRATAENPLYRLERYVDDRGEKEAKQTLGSLFGRKDVQQAYSEIAYWYDHDMNICGYRLPSLAVDVLCQEIDRMNMKANCRILDVAAGTGQNALLLMRDKMTEIEALDICDKMLSEARRKALYRAYYVADANEKLDLRPGSFDIAMCVGGVEPNHIKASSVIGEMVKVVREGGLVLLTVREHDKDSMKEIERLVSADKAKVVRQETGNGVSALGEIRHCIMVLRVL
ncbi:unnamed protein product [Agarophyton chilense]|eukprot:gb/GEZJ01001607.1/.p1 GENE.gb/GEZJ01001607.1/~~gb/GEZJ01001607.1/.p1  ORF type:complete len:490 (-),score=71.88 gb/GEZJ01001607.1/:1849-3318(-)